MTDLRAQLQATLGNGYTLERELGGGGMSHVFVAHENALGRTVVVKVIAPELAEGVSAERFAREIKLAAALQEPHIVPVLAAGATREGLPYYTMPYVRGDSRRARLLKGPVSLGDTLGILRNIAQALANAHERGIATSSPRTCCCRAAPRLSPTSASRKRSRRQARSPQAIR